MKIVFKLLAVKIGVIKNESNGDKVHAFGAMAPQRCDVYFHSSSDDRNGNAFL